MKLILAKYKKEISAIAVVIFLGLIILSLTLFFADGDKTPSSQADFSITIPNAGGLLPLDAAMKENRALRQAVKKVLNYDEAYLFVNYRQINSDIANILFLWAGLSLQEIKSLGGEKSVDAFLRRYHGLPADFIIENNPMLGERPWPRTFNIMKSRLLMMGQGHKIYDGVAYYNSETDKMVIQGTLSENFINGFVGFLNTRPENDRTRFSNNFLAFIDSTKGLNNLSLVERNNLKLLRF